MRFFRQFLDNPATTGAICSSSPFLAATIVRAAKVSEASHILEIGPGDGAFTRCIIAEKRPEARLRLVEKNPFFAEEIRRKFPDIPVYLGCASEFASQHPEETEDSIVSGLPWAAFDESLQRRILSSITRLLAPGGTFATFAYYGPHMLPAGRRFRSLLHEYFSHITTTPLVLINLPPAFVYMCKI